MSRSHNKSKNEYENQRHLRDPEFVKQMRKKLNKDNEDYKRNLEEYLRLKGELE